MEQLGEHKGAEEDVSISGKIVAVRDHGKLLFIDLYDRTGSVQCFVPSSHSMFAEAQKLSPESVLTLVGKVQERPEKNRTEGQNGDIEFVVEELVVVARAQELPFDLEMADLNLDTRFDYRPLTLRRADDPGSVSGAGVDCTRVSGVFDFARGLLSFRRQKLSVVMLRGVRRCFRLIILM